MSIWFNEVMNNRQRMGLMTENEANNFLVFGVSSAQPSDGNPPNEGQNPWK